METPTDKFNQDKSTDKSGLKTGQSLVTIGVVAENKQQNTAPTVAKGANKSHLAANAELPQQLKELSDSAIVPPTVAVGISQHSIGTPNQYNNNAIFTDGNDFVLINVTLTNKSSKTTVFDVNAFKLKDANNTSYPYYTNSAVGGEPRYLSGFDGLPSGITEIKSQNLAPNETLQETLIFLRTGVAQECKPTQRPGHLLHEALV